MNNKINNMLEEAIQIYYLIIRIMICINSNINRIKKNWNKV